MHWQDSSSYKINFNNITILFVTNKVYVQTNTIFKCYLYSQKISAEPLALLDHYLLLSLPYFSVVALRVPYLIKRWASIPRGALHIYLFFYLQEVEKCSVVNDNREVNIACLWPSIYVPDDIPAYNINAWGNILFTIRLQVSSC